MEPDQKAKRAYRDGPIIVRRTNGDGRTEPVAVCRCGLSKIRPQCDGSHRPAGFRAKGFEGWDA